MNDQTRKALELALRTLQHEFYPSARVEAIAAIDAALSAPAAPVALTDERAAFEAWFKGVSKKVHLERCGDTYFGDWAACAWEGWQARCAAPAAPVAQPLTDEQIDAARKQQ